VTRPADGATTVSTSGRTRRRARRSSRLRGGHRINWCRLRTADAGRALDCTAVVYLSVGPTELDEGEHEASVDADADGQDRFHGSRRPQERDEAGYDDSKAGVQSPRTPQDRRPAVGAVPTIRRSVHAGRLCVAIDVWGQSPYSLSSTPWPAQRESSPAGDPAAEPPDSTSCKPSQPNESRHRPADEVGL
jgi:hypothetical protein